VDLVRLQHVSPERCDERLQQNVHLMDPVAIVERSMSTPSRAWMRLCR
jgi:hypothetical protein